jgi:Tfp pilus assembly protein PilV
MPRPAQAATAHPAAAPCSSQRGSTLAEALVACLVLGLGVLAWLRLPALTAGELAAARARQDAAHAAGALAAELHAQHDYGADPVARRLRRTLLPPARRPATDCVASDCTPEQMADAQLWLWGEMVHPRLPGARAELDCAAASAPGPGGPAGPGACTLRMHLAPAGARESPPLQWRLHP